VGCELIELAMLIRGERGNVFLPSHDDLAQRGVGDEQRTLLAVEG
jgi:hypothetical protein